jgi:hypothetical protein
MRTARRHVSDGVAVEFIALSASTCLGHALAIAHQRVTKSFTRKSGNSGLIRLNGSIPIH